MWFLPTIYYELTCSPMAVSFSAYNFKTKTDKDVHYVFDIVRKKWVVLTPEEWVRQHVIHFLVHDKGYAASLLAVERGFDLHGRRKRFDVLVFDNQGNACIIVECKRPDMALSEDTMQQVAQYNAVFGAPILWITNGQQHAVVEYSPDFSSYNQLQDVPSQC
jgi:hypothetical protein